MAKNFFPTSEIHKSQNGFSASSLSSSTKDPLFHRRIEFHLAGKSFNPYGSSSSNGSGDFHLETLNPNADSQKVQKVVGGSSGGGVDVFEHGLDPELSLQISVRRIGAGLANLGNTCFLNSILQCLTYTEPFAAYLQSGKHKSSCHTAGFCAMCALQNHVRNALQSTGKILSPSHLVKNLRCVSRNFRNSRQEDAHEYMVNLLESMHKCCLPHGVSSESPAAYEKSLVHKIFGGRLRSQVKCMQCSYCSNKFDPFLDLSLEIVKADSLCKALAHFTTVEQLDGGAKQYHCQRCKEKVRALKQLTVHKAPYVLTIHLKRFGSDNPGQKIDRKVEFASYLDLKPFASDPHEGDLFYTLYGVLVHAGWSTHCGHYYCFVRTASGMWYSLDDNRVLQVSERTVLEQKAYMLFYVRNRRNAAPKKLLDARNENTGALSTTIKELPVVSSIKKGQMERKLSAALIATVGAPSTSGQYFSVAGAAVTEIPSKKATTVQANPQLVVEAGALKSSKVDMAVKDPLPKKPPNKDLSVKEQSSSIEMSKIHVAQPSVCNGFNPPSSENGSGGVHKRGQSDPCERAGGPKFETSASPKLPCQSSTPNGCTPGKSLNDGQNVDVSVKKSKLTGHKAGEIVHNYENTVKLSSRSKDTDDYVQNKFVDAMKLQRGLKPKKPNKCPPIMSLRIGPKQLFLASLSLRKKKTHNRSKHQSLGVKTFAKKDLMEGSTSSDQGTSTSEKTEMDEQEHTFLRKRKGHREANVVKHCNGSTQNSKERCRTEGGGLHSAVLASDLLLEKRFDLTEKGYDMRQPFVQGKRASAQNGLTTTFLKEATVAQWDDTVLPSIDVGLGQLKERSVGYVADDWDEEYDKGKRKKVRKSYDSFDGQNLFQEIATKKAQLKKMKMAPSSAGNRPFRITKV